MSNWTFNPPYPEVYYASDDRCLFIAAEPNGDNQRPDKKDMGEWLRHVPKTGTKFYRSLVSIAAMFENVDVNFKDETAAKKLLSKWRFIDLVSEEAGAQVQGDFLSRVENNVSNTLNIISKDNPGIIVVLGSHAQKAFEKILVPRMKGMKSQRVGMPHPSTRDGGYLTRELAGDPSLMLRKPFEKMMVFSHKKGWVRHD